MSLRPALAAACLCSAVLAPGPSFCADAPDTAAVVTAIIAEATRPNGDPVGRPLPLAAHWNTGHYARARGMDPAFEISLIEEGHHVLPGFQLNAPHWGPVAPEYYEAAIKRAAALKLPITFVGTQFESLLTDDQRFFDLPPEKNPNTLGADGKIQKRVSPFGPVEPWREAGRLWTARPLVAQLQQWYPDPPLVIFLSNNEHAKLTWNQAEQSKRYLDAHGRGKDDDFKRQVFAAGWIERYRALQAGMREGLTAPAWKKNAIFVGYEAFGPAHLARWGGWMEYSLTSKGRINPWPLAWDGGTPSYYVHNWNPSTDYTVWGPQIESMNWLFMLDEACALNPRFWWEISVWDGHEPTRDDDMRKVYARRGQTFTPERYRGFVQFGMWLLRPRAVREFRGWTDSRDTMMPFYKEILAAVDRVHRDKTLADFWRKGALVPNRTRQHPYQERVPEEYKKADRWFLLETEPGPEWPLTLTSEIPVFALALVRGAPPAREWLVYAHSPVEAITDVQITLPDYGPVKSDVPRGGTFLVVSEQGRAARPLTIAGE